MYSADEITAEADYVEIPGVTPTPYPTPIKQTVAVENKSESQILLVLDLRAEPRSKGTSRETRFGSGIT